MMGLLAVAIVTLTLQMSVASNPEDNFTCHSKDCIRTAERVMDSLNRSVDPCEDFYSFACGGWIAKHPIPEDQTSTSVPYVIIFERLLKNLKLLLEQSDQQEDPKSVRMARSFYRTCMNTTSIENLGLNPVYKVMDSLKLPRKLPLDDAAIPELDFSELAGKVRRLFGIDLFFKFYIIENFFNRTQNLMTIEKMTVSFGDPFLDERRFLFALQEYKKYVISMAELGGAGNRSAEFAEEIVNFSQKLIVSTPEEIRSNKEVTVDKLQQLIDIRAVQWNWTVYLNNVFNNTNVTIAPEEDVVNVENLEHLGKLPQLLAATPRSTLVRFVWWSVYSTLAKLTLPEFYDLYSGFMSDVFVQMNKKPRWVRCVTDANKDFGMALSHVYVRHHFDEQKRAKALEILNNVKKAFESIISELKWMDAGARAQALRNLQGIRSFVGFPDWITKPDKLDEFYKGVEVVEGKLFETTLKLIDTNQRKSLSSLREKPDHDQWIIPMTSTKVFYSPIANSINVPAVYFQPPFYGNGIESIDYGAIGSTMGHELMHLFDLQGKIPDENGNPRWSSKTLRHYREKVECIIKQYSSYHVPELGNNTKVNGVITYSENIADNGGLREAYRAYQNLTSGSPNQLTLPGLANYTQEQLFFLGFAQGYCSNFTNKGLRMLLSTNVHTPNRFRVIGTLSNNAEFAKAWQCPEGSRMNPVNKCVL